MKAAAFIMCGGLFADNDPSLDHVRGAMDALANARRSDLPVLAVVSHRSSRTDGVQFLTELGLINQVLDPTSQASLITPKSGRRILLRAGGSANQLTESSDMSVVIVPFGVDTIETLDYATHADLIIDARSSLPNFDLSAIPPIVRPGHAAPSVNGGTVSGFTLVDVENRRTSNPTFVEIEAIQSLRISIDCNDPGKEKLAPRINRAIIPSLGKADLLYIALSGSVSRDDWHTVNPRKLITSAAAVGTLVRLDLSNLLVDRPIAARKHRSSFLVHARRIADAMIASTDEIAEQRAISSARTHVSSTTRTREAVEATT